MAVLRYPKYYEDFECIAGACTDSCCMHWEIDIDDGSLGRYMNVPGEFGKRLKESIFIDEEGGHFKMDSHERCAFLNGDGLCDLILNMGEDSLCQICAEHPRYYDSFSYGEETGVGLCCEVAARLILDSDVSNELVEKEIPYDCCGDELAEAEEQLLEERTDFLENIEDFSAIWKGYGLETGTDLDTDRGVSEFVSCWADDFYTEETLEALIELLLSLEINSPSWEEMLTELRERLPEVIAKRKDFLKAAPEVKDQIKRVLEYFIYRYYMMARYEENIKEGADTKLMFAMTSAGMILICDTLKWLKEGCFTFEDQVNICKLYSQEIEYDTDNVFEIELFWS